MLYDFDMTVNRRGTYSMKWDVNEDVIPMWVADMDFQTAPEIIEEIQKRASHGVFGYSLVPQEWNEAICGWWKKRHNFEINSDWLVFCTGVVPAISSIVRKMTTAGENVLVLTPVYNIFFNSIVNNGRIVLESRLTFQNNEYSINFEDLEKKLADPQTTLMLLCNPHNPIGKIWDKETLHHIAELCKKHHVLVVSDEIHCDLTDPHCDYIPFASVSDWCAQNSITCLAPTKAFNLAGLQTAAVMIPNSVIRHKVERGLNTDEVAEPSSFAVPAAIAAFTRGADWLDSLRAYVLENKKIVQSFLQAELPQVMLVPSQATYLLWLDCRQISFYSSDMCDYLAKNSGLLLSGGNVYGESGNGFLRMNIACSKIQLEKGLSRLKDGLLSYQDYWNKFC
jgi:cystathionine beta-lyase